MSRASFHNFQNIVEKSADGIIIVDREGVVRFVNSVVESLFGLKVEELLGELFGFPIVSGKSLEVDIIRRVGETGVGEMRIVETEWDGESAYLISIRDITERKQAEKALLESKAYTESIIQNFLDTLIVVDTEAKIQTVNPATCELLGYTEEALIGQPLSIIFAEEEEEEEVHRVFQFFREPEKAEALRPLDTISNRELIYKTRDGRLIPMLFNASVLIDEADSVTGMVAGAKDITELKLVEAEIRREKRFLENIIATVPESLLVLGKDLRIKSANRSFYERFRTEPETVIGTRITDILGDEDEKLSTALTKLSGTEDMLEDFELHYHSEKLGEWIFNITTRGIVVAEEEEELVVIEDITERRRAEESLLESEEKYHSLVESTADFVSLVDRDCRYTFINERHLSRLGLPAEKVIGRTYGEFHSEDDTKEFAEKIEKVFETGKSTQHEHRSRRDDRYFLRTLSPVKDSEGRTLAITVVSKDITEWKQAEEAIKASLREKEMLLREIHHQVKNNLQIISSLLNLQSGQITDNQAFTLFRESQSRVRSMALVHEKLYQSRDLARVDFAEYVRSLTRHLFTLYHSAAITLEMDITEVLLDIDTAIPCGLIITELVSNCLKYAFPAGKEGEIRITLRSDNNKLTLTISDNGVGFPKELDFRNTQTLGLQLVCNLVEQLEGTIELDRRDGTEFTITFAEQRKNKI